MSASAWRASATTSIGAAIYRVATHARGVVIHHWAAIVASATSGVAIARLVGQRTAWARAWPTHYHRTVSDACAIVGAIVAIAIPVAAIVIAIIAVVVVAAVVPIVIAIVAIIATETTITIAHGVGIVVATSPAAIAPSIHGSIAIKRIIHEGVDGIERRRGRTPERIIRKREGVAIANEGAEPAIGTEADAELEARPIPRPVEPYWAGIAKATVSKASVVAKTVAKAIAIIVVDGGAARALLVVTAIAILAILVAIAVVGVVIVGSGGSLLLCLRGCGSSKGRRRIASIAVATLALVLAHIIGARGRLGRICSRGGRGAGGGLHHCGAPLPGGVVHIVCTHNLLLARAGT